MVQTKDSSKLGNAQRIIVNAVRFTEEHNAPMMALTEQFTLGQGEKTVTVPKVAQVNVTNLVDGQDIVDSEDIGMTTIDLTSAEVGGKMIITDKLVRQSVPSVFSMVGRQFGDGMARQKDTDVQALYTNLNGGVLLGLAGKELSSINWTGCIAFAKANKFGNKLYGVHHPNAVVEFVKSAAITPGATYPMPAGWAADLLKEFFVGLRPINGVPLFEAGNIPEDSSGDGIGVIADQGALATLTSVKMNVERERDASLRAYEVVVVSDYGVFELDDTRGAGMLYDITAPVTSN